MHLASAFDVSMAAGAAAAAWQPMGCLRDSTLRPCLLDSGSAARFRRIDFNIRDLALLAAAFAKTDVSSKELACVFNDVVIPGLADVPVRDLCCFLLAAAHVAGWATEPFAAASAGEVVRRKPNTFGPQDLCTLAQSLSKLGHCGSESLAKVWEATFSRQLLGFSPRDKAVCLSVLAGKNATEHPALCRMLVRSLAAGDHRVLDSEQIHSTLIALAQVWPLLADDPLPLLLLSELIEAQPWRDAGLNALMQLTLVFAQLSLEPAPSGAMWDPVVARVGTELAARLGNGETLMEADAQRLVESLRHAPRAAPMLPHQLAAELLNLLSADEEAAMPSSGFQPQSRRAPHDSPKVTPDTFSTDLIPTDFVMPQSCRFCGSLPGLLLPAGPAVERGRSLRRRRLHSDYHHGPGGHGHVHGHSHEAGSDGEEEPHCEPLADLIRSASASRGAQCDEDSSHAHTHGHIQECGTELTSHEQPHSSCGDSTCCCSFGAKHQGAEVRLNAHCDFRGHCVQLKHTFIHIPCNDSDSDNEGGNCVVCRLARSSSV